MRRLDLTPKSGQRADLPLWDQYRKRGALEDPGGYVL